MLVKSEPIIYSEEMKEQIRKADEERQRRIAHLEYKATDVSEIRPFRLNDCDWVAARSLEEAIEWYCLETGMERDEAIDDGFCYADDLSMPVYRDEIREGPPNTTVGQLIVEHALRWTFPCVIASTGY